MKLLDVLNTKITMPNVSNLEKDYLDPPIQIPDSIRMLDYNMNKTGPLKPIANIKKKLTSKVMPSGGAQQSQ